MAVVLTVTDDEIAALCRLDIGDAQVLADCAEVLANAQEACEAMLRAEALADSTLTFVLRRGVAKLLAADVLAMRRREEGAGTSFQGAGITLGRPADYGAELRAEALRDLAPYLRRPEMAHVVGDGTAARTSAASGAAQTDLFGRSEGDRARNYATEGL